MFRFLENLVDPYQPYSEQDAPPTRLWPFLKDYIRPFKGIFAVTAVFSVGNAVLDVGMIWYLSRLVDLMTNQTPQDFLTNHWTEIMVAAFVILVIRPLVAGGSVGLLHNTILTNFGTMMRWRAHRHVLRQPVGWFESDFAGRAAATFLGALIMLADADPRLMIPLLIWLVAYIGLMRWTIRRAGPAATASSDARSAVTGRVVDSYTNIHSVKLFAHQDSELNYAKESIENARTTFQKEMRIVTKMDMALTFINGHRWRGCRGCGAGPAAPFDDLLDHVGLDPTGAEPRHPRRRDGDDCPARHSGRQTQRAAACVQQGPVGAEGRLPPLRPRLRGPSERQPHHPPR